MPQYRLLFSRERVFTVLIEARDKDAAWSAAQSIEGQVRAKDEPYAKDIGWAGLNLFNGSVQGCTYGEFEVFEVEPCS